MKSTDNGNSWTIIKENAYTFGSEGKFLFASIQKKGVSNARLKMGANITTVKRNIFISWIFVVFQKRWLSQGINGFIVGLGGGGC
jgi:hypothetical protein